MPGLSQFSLSIPDSEATRSLIIFHDAQSFIKLKKENNFAVDIDKQYSKLVLGNIFTLITKNFYLLLSEYTSDTPGSFLECDPPGRCFRECSL